MKSSNKNTILLFIAMFLMLAFVQQNASAQCQIIKLDADGNIIGTTPISCDFPVFYETGNLDVDNMSYDVAKATWVENYPDDYQVYTEGFNYMEIHQADFDAMSHDKQMFLLADPGMYRVIPQN
jgi:hypothetical protein